MNWFGRVFNYSVGRKLVMSLTGLFLLSFLIVHVSGNFLLFAGDNGAAFNAYSHVMTTNPIILAIEWALVFGFLFHIVDGVYLYIRNRRARPVRYKYDKVGQVTFWTSRNMMLSGAIVLLFLLIHLNTFFVPYRLQGNIPDLYALTREMFLKPWYSLFYVASMVLLAFHLHHGIASAFQTLGLRHPSYYNAIRFVGVFLAIVICGGFAAMPLYFLLERFI